MIININIVDKYATVAGAPVIVCGNTGYTVQFSFDSEWDGLGIKTARFVYVQDGAVKYQDVVFEGITVDMPAMVNTKEVRVGVFAGNLSTTTPARIPCEYSIRCGTGAPEEPTPSQYDQIMELLNQEGSSIIVDSVLSETSENPVQNKAITAKLKELSGSSITVDTALSETSENPVQNKVIAARISELSEQIASLVDGNEVEY